MAQSKYTEIEQVIDTIIKKSNALCINPHKQIYDVVMQVITDALYKNTKMSTARTKDGTVLAQFVSVYVDETPLDSYVGNLIISGDSYEQGIKRITQFAKFKVYVTVGKVSVEHQMQGVSAVNRFLVAMCKRESAMRILINKTADILNQWARTYTITSREGTTQLESSLKKLFVEYKKLMPPSEVRVIMGGMINGYSAPRMKWDR